MPVLDATLLQCRGGSANHLTFELSLLQTKIKNTFSARYVSLKIGGRFFPITFWGSKEKSLEDNHLHFLREPICRDISSPIAIFELIWLYIHTYIGKCVWALYL